MECMLTDAFGVAYNLSYLEQGWQVNCTVVAQVNLFTYGALLFWANFFITKTRATSRQDEVIYSL